MWKHQTFEESVFGTAENVRMEVIAFLNRNNLSSTDVHISETRTIGLTGPTATLEITVYWFENTISRRRA